MSRRYRLEYPVDDPDDVDEDDEDGYDDDEEGDGEEDDDDGEEVETWQVTAA